MRVTESDRMTDDHLTALLIAVRGELPTTPYGIVVQDEHGSILSWTRPAEHILNMTGDQMLGRTSLDPLWSTISGDGEPLLGDRHPAMTVLRTGTPVTEMLIGVRRGRTADLDYVWVLVDSYPVDLPGRAERVISCFHEVEPERTDGLQLQHSERMFRLITERLHEVVGLHGLDGTWLWASPSTKDVFGYTPDELIGTSTFDLIESTHLDRARSALTSLTDRGGPVTVILPVRHRSGATRWVEVIGQVICDPDGRPFQLQTSFRDVSDRVVAQSERDAAVEVFTSIVRTSPTGMMLVDPGGRVTQVNTALHNLLMLPDDTLPADLHVLDLVHHESLNHVALEREAIATGERTSMKYQAQWILPEQRGLVWIESVTVPVRDGRGALTAVLEQITDITSEKLAAAELERRATLDAVTGLLNRDTFLAAVDGALDERPDENDMVTVVFIDLDHFKSINDTWGHHIGDAALRAVADRLTGVIGVDGWVARYGGDEFAIAHPGPVDAIAVVTAKIRTAFDRPFVLGDGIVLQISASIGVARERDGDSADLIQDADRAMYLAKHRRGGNR
ncbi:MAG: diguanylate cyclase [Rhodococcus sp. (in: high G+C Gram-positive bacteria)]